MKHPATIFFVACMLSLVVLALAYGATALLLKFGVFEE